MADVSWTNSNEIAIPEAKSGKNRLLFAGAAVAIIVAIALLVVNAMSGNTQLYKTVDEFYADQTRLVGRDLRVSGWVVGETVKYTQIDADSSILEFDIVDNLENPGQRLHVVAYDEPKPDLLQNRAQALVEGRGDANGVFTSNPGGLMLKCPTRYEEMQGGHPTSIPVPQE